MTLTGKAVYVLTIHTYYEKGEPGHLSHVDTVWASAEDAKACFPDAKWESVNDGAPFPRLILEAKVKREAVAVEGRVRITLAVIEEQEVRSLS